MANNSETKDSLQSAPGTSLPLMEHFYTIQGEGAHTGMPAYFIRLAGCDVGCRWCDVKESWDETLHPSVSIYQMLTWVLEAKAKNVVITGGEPSLHNLQPLITLLQANKLQVWMETAGTSPMTQRPNWVCLSPKKFKAPRTEWLQAADELKIVVFHPSDIDWALQFLPELPPHCIKWLQPEWERQAQMLPHIISWIKHNPDWKISLQTHKYMNIP